MFNTIWNYLTSDRASEAIRELEVIKDKPDVLLCSTMALIHAHKKAKLVDREAVQELETKLRQDRQSCGEMALYFGGMFLWHTGRHDKAREYIDRMIKMASGNKEVGKIQQNVPLNAEWSLMGQQEKVHWLLCREYPLPAAAEREDVCS